MCTATLHAGPARALITFNRDERIEREPESAPAEFGPPGLRWIAPLDSRAGGTWIAVNSAGLAATLMNGYRESDTRPAQNPPDDTPEDGLVSRGTIIPTLMAHQSRSAALACLAHRFDPAPYASFRLTLLDRTGATEYVWDGQTAQPPRELPHPWCFQSSSSWRQAEVVAWRAEAFDEWMAQDKPFSGHIPGFHLLQPAGMEAWAPLMRREYAMTRSITQVELDWAAGKAEMRYFPLISGQQIVAPPAIARLAL